MIPILKLVPGIKEKLEALRNQTITVKQLVHFCQLEISGKFQKFDYNMEDRALEGNLDKYGIDTPPLLHIEEIDIPVGMWVVD